MIRAGDSKYYKIDLHLHSSVSDGKYSPHEAMALCKKRNLEVVSFVEHNYIALSGLYEVPAKQFRVKVIPGIEISTSFGKRTFHLIGYFKEFPRPEFNKPLEPLVKGYERRAKRIIRKCQQAGIPISYKTLRKNYSEVYLSRYAIAEEVCRVLKLASIQEAFLLAEDKGGLFWAKDDFSFPKVTTMIKHIHKHGGIAILAHPWEKQTDTLPADLLSFIKNGLDGIEIYYPKHSHAAIKFLEEVVRENGLLATGGSDWHGEARTPGYALGSGGVSRELLAQLVKKLDEGYESIKK